MPARRSLRRSSLMSVKMSVNIWKWRIGSGFSCSHRHPENHFHLGCGNGGSGDFHISTISTPYGGTGLRWTFRSAPGRRRSWIANSATARGGRFPVNVCPNETLAALGHFPQTSTMERSPCITS